MKLIDGNKAQAVLVNMAEHLLEAGNPEMAGAVGYAAEVIGNQKPINAVEVRHGSWDDKYGGAFVNPRYSCSVCKGEALYQHERNELGGWEAVQALTDYCPICGAKMDGGRT